MHLGYGLAAILAFIGVKLVLHWAHRRWESVPEIPTLASPGVIVGILAVTVCTASSSPAAGRTPLSGRGRAAGESRDEDRDPART